MTATVAPPPSLNDTHADPGLAATVRSEWSKLWSSRAPRRNLILGAVLGVALSALLSFAVGSSFDEWGASEQREFDPVLFSFIGSILTSIFFVAVGARVATSEYASGMIRLTLSVTPKRWRVLAAKLLVVAIATWIFGAVAMAGMIAVSQAILASYDLQTSSLLDGEVLRTLGLVILFIPLFPILATVGGILFRSTAPTITAVLLLLFVPGFFGNLFPVWWRENILSLFPGSAVDALSIGPRADSQIYHDTPVALLATIAWIVVPIAVAHVVLNRRDA